MIKPNSLGNARRLYKLAHNDLCEDNKHSLEWLKLISDVDRYVALLEETVCNLSDPTENAWKD